MKVNEGASGPIQEQVAQPGSGEKVNEEELNLFIVAENVQQSENTVTNEDQENPEMDVAKSEIWWGHHQNCIMHNFYFNWFFCITKK